MHDESQQAPGKEDESRLDWVPMVVIPAMLVVVVPASVASNNEIDVLSIPATVWLRLLSMAVVVGAVIGIVVAGLGAIGALLSLPAYPFWSLAIFAVDVLVIYGLAAYGARGPRVVA